MLGFVVINQLVYWSSLELLRFRILQTDVKTLNECRTATLPAILLNIPCYIVFVLSDNFYINC